MKRWLVLLMIIPMVLLVNCGQASEPTPTTKTYENDFIKVTIPYETFVQEESKTKVNLAHNEEFVSFELEDGDYSQNYIVDNGFESELNGISCHTYCPVEKIGEYASYCIPYGDQTIEVMMILGEISIENKLAGMVRGTLELKNVDIQ